MLKYGLQVFILHPVIQETVIAYFLKAGRQHVHEVAAYKFCMAQGNEAHRVTRIFTSGQERNGILCKGKNPAVGNGYFMGIAPKVFHGIAKSVKSLFYVRAPVLAIKGVFELLPSIGITEPFTGRGEGEQPFLVHGIKQGKIFALKLIAQYPNRNEKLVFGFPDFPIFGKPAAGDNAVHVHMVTHFLVPCMEDLDDAGGSPEPLFISR